MVSGDQFLNPIVNLIATSEDEFDRGARIEEQKQIPNPEQTPMRGNKWLKIPAVISVFVDLKNSTQLSASKHDRSTAEIYQYFTNTVARIMHEFGASYIDIKGDGVFGLFNEDLNHTALAAAVTCKSFVAESFRPKTRAKRGVDLGCHIGIDRKTVLVKKIGIEPRGSDDSRLRNEVWAGQPVNVSSKLAAEADAGELFASQRFHNKLTHPYAKHACDCGDGCDLWDAVDVSSDDRFKFSTILKLTSNWCLKHGAEYCQDLIDSERAAISEAVRRRDSASALLGP